MKLYLIKFNKYNNKYFYFIIYKLLYTIRNLIKLFKENLLYFSYIYSLI